MVWPPQDSGTFDQQKCLCCDDACCQLVLGETIPSRDAALVAVGGTAYLTAPKELTFDAQVIYNDVTSPYTHMAIAFELRVNLTAGDECSLLNNSYFFGDGFTSVPVSVAVLKSTGEEVTSESFDLIDFEPYYMTFTIPTTGCYFFYCTYEIYGTEIFAAGLDSGAFTYTLKVTSGADINCPDGFTVVGATVDP